MSELLMCPICREALHLDGKTWQCVNRHSYDQAKQGYVNLHVVQHKHSKNPGDTAESVQARRAFLSAGFYAPLQQAVVEKIRTLKIETLLDIGCGEGYYSHRLFHVFEQDHPCVLQGLDISKSAIKYAAKRYPNLQFCVASAYEMPIASQTVDLAIRIYAPSKVEELQRIMAKNGVLITVSPGPMHHFALKQQIYAEPRLHPESNASLEGFVCIHQQRLMSQLGLKNAEHISHFLEMTPYAWKFTTEQKQALVAQGLNCELDFQIEVYRIAR